MNRLLRILAATVIALLLSAGGAFATYYHYQIDVYRDKGFRTTSGGYGSAVTSGVQYMVFDSGTQTISTIYSDEGSTSKTNPVSATTFGTDTKIDFYAGADGIDILVVDNTGGYTLFLDGVTTSTSLAVINEVPEILHHGIIWYSASCDATNVKDLDGTGTAGAYDTGIDVAAGTVIQGLSVEVLSETVTSDILMAVGLAATNQGLIQAAETDKLTGPTFMNSYLYYSDQSETFYGTLMVVGKASDAESGTAVRERVPYMVTTAASLTYSFESADEQDGDSFAAFGHGYIHWWFVPAWPR